MNALFVHYGEGTANSLNHIGVFARCLLAQGHLVAATGPDNWAATWSERPEALRCFSHRKLLTDPGQLNWNGNTIIHLWTPRAPGAPVATMLRRQFGEQARLVVHLEDNEAHLYQEAIRKAKEGSIWRRQRRANQAKAKLSPPELRTALLKHADAATVIVDSLQRDLPKELPRLRLFPGVDLTDFSPEGATRDLHREFNLPPGTRFVAYPGGVNFANEQEVRTLYEAIEHLNQSHCAVRLIRTGPPNDAFRSSLTPTQRDIALELGFVKRAELPAILRSADALVQPGETGTYNDLRLPSKLPEFLACGRPVVLPASNLGQLLRDGKDALVLKTGTAAEISERCQWLFSNPQRAIAIGAGGRRFAEQHFDSKSNTTALTTFYKSILSQSARFDWSAAQQATRDGSRIHLPANPAGRTIT